MARGPVLRRTLLAALPALAIASRGLAQTPPAPLIGVWDGLLQLPGGRLRLALEISEAGDGYGVVLRSLDQGGGPIPATIKTASGKIAIEAASINARLDGAMAADGRLVMTFTQLGAPSQIVFSRRPGGAAPPPLPRTLLGPVPSDADILAELKSRIDVEKRGVGLVVGIVDAAGKRRIIAYGARAKGSVKPLDGDTLFEIGSITKTFTSLLLADAVRRGEVKLDDPLVKYLPPGSKVPERGGRQITLIDLATHTSGLPRMPANFAPANRANPYADYPAERLYAFLADYQLPRDIGVTWDYSNYGVALLGQALARRAGTDYDTLVRTRVLRPLGMTSTAIKLTPALAERFATAHDAELNAVSEWNLDGFAPAGALRSSANDMLTLLAVESGARQSPLSAAMADQLRVRRPRAVPNQAQALGWQVASYLNGELASHGGATAGFQTFAGFDRGRRLGVVVLSNTANPVEDIGLYVLGGPHPATLAPRPPRPSSRPAIAIDPAILPAYAGVYRLGPKFTVTVTVEDGKLMVGPTGQAKRALIPVGRDEFVVTGVEALVTFHRDVEDKVFGLALAQNGQTSNAPREPDPR
ncbi:serine hydrolase [Phenylobacterium sp.]|uniref:serine hydrolase n=1 Tax=Phenylobacterium sp. TaxID=1871053 RepID=UPI003563B98C